MRLILHLLGRSLRTHRLKTALVISGIALGVATVVAIFTLDVNTIQARLEARGAGEVRVDLQVLLGAGVPLDDRQTLAALEGLDGVSRAVRVCFSRALLSSPGEEPSAVQLIGLGAGLGDAFAAFEIGFGSLWSEPFVRSGPVPLLIGARLAQERGWGVGTRLEGGRGDSGGGVIKRCEEGREVLVRSSAAGVASPPRRVPLVVAGVLERARLGLRAGGAVALVPFDAAAEILARPALDRLYWIRRAPGADLEELARAVRRLLPEAVVDSGASAVVGEDPDERAFRNGVRVAGVLALMLGLFVVFHTLSMSLLERMRQIGIYAALGMTRGTMAVLFLLEVALQAGAGVLAGVGLGLGLARLLLAAGITTLGVQPGGIALFLVPWRQVAAIALLGFAVALVGTIHPLWRSRSWTPHRLLLTRDLRPGRPLMAGLDLFLLGVLLVVVPVLYFFVVQVVGRDAVRVLGVFLAGLAFFSLLILLLHVAPRILRTLARGALLPWRLFWPLETHLAERNMSAVIGRVSASVCGIALFGAALIALRGMTTTLKDEIRSYADQALVDKLFVELEPSRPGQRAAAPITLRGLRDLVAELAEVDGFEPSSHELSTPFTVRGVDLEAASTWGPLRDPSLRRRLADMANPAMLVSRRVGAFKPGLLEEGHIYLPTRSASGAVAVTILGVSDFYGSFGDERLFGVVSDEFFHHYHCMDLNAVTRFALHIAPGVDPARAEERVRAHLASSRRLVLRTGIARRDRELADIDRDFILFDVILGLVALLAGTALVNALWIGALERLKEISVLKALGMTPAQVRRTVGVEALTSGVLGGLLGIVLGVPCLLLVILGLEEISGLDLQPIIPWGQVGLSVVLCSLIGVLAGILPGWRIARLQPVLALRYE